MLGGAAPLNSEYAIHLLDHDWGLFGMKGFFLSGATYDVGVMVLFLFQMVFMDTALTIVTGAVAERWKYVAFCVSSIVLGAITYPLFAHWAWGGGWLAKLGTNFGLGAGYADFAGSGVVHSVGAMTALAGALIIGPRIGKYNRDGSSNAIPGHDIVIVLTGCFILAFGWFGFNPGSTLGASGALRISTVAVDTMLAGCTGSFGAVLYMWIKYGKPDASMSGNGLLAGLVAITAPSGYVNSVAACIIGLIAGVLVSTDGRLRLLIRSDRGCKPVGQPVVDGEECPGADRPHRQDDHRNGHHQWGFVRMVVAAVGGLEFLPARLAEEGHDHHSGHVERRDARADQRRRAEYPALGALRRKGRLDDRVLGVEAVEQREPDDRQVGGRHGPEGDRQTCGRARRSAACPRRRSSRA